MNVFPVIERELRSEARSVVTYGCRSLGAGLLLLASMMFLGTRAVGLSGRELFGELHQLLLITIWLWVPLVSADCISREKREQTLGLLFLTPLSARDIMLAKTLTQGLRAATIGVAVIPVLTLPLVIGGLHWPGVVSSILINTSAFCWALAAGLLASVLSRSLLGSLLWALLWAAVFLVVLAMLNGIVVIELASYTGGRQRYLPSLEGLAGMGLLAMWTGEPSSYRSLPGLTAGGTQFWLLGSTGLLFCSLGGLALVWQIGAWRLQKAWQELPPSPARERVEKEFCQPRFAIGFFRWLMKRRMNRNPVGWLERRRWTSRAAAWGWLGIFALGYTAFYVNFTYTRQVNNLNVVMAASFMAAMALTSSASFRRERETGVMELLLTTPLTPEQIVRGRLFGLWVQFLPSFVVLVFMAGFSGFFLHWTSLSSAFLLCAWVGGVFYLSVPVCGLWFSLLARQYLVSLLLTVMVGMVGPFVLMQFLDAALVRTQNGSWLALWTHPFLGGIALFGLLAAGWGGWQMRGTLGFFGLSMIGAALAGILLALRYPWMWGRFYEEQVGPFTILMPCFAIAVAGFSHLKLLRMLRERTFGFKV